MFRGLLVDRKNILTTPSLHFVKFICTQTKNFQLILFQLSIKIRPSVIKSYKTNDKTSCIQLRYNFTSLQIKIHTEYRNETEEKRRNTKKKQKQNIKCPKWMMCKCVQVECESAIVGCDRFAVHFIVSLTFKLWY